MNTQPIQSAAIGEHIIYKGERYQYIANHNDCYHVLKSPYTEGEFALANNDLVSVIDGDTWQQAFYWHYQSDNNEMAIRAMYYENNEHNEHQYTLEDITVIINTIHDERK